MRSYKIREPENNDIVECIKVLYLSFGRPSFDDTSLDYK